MSARLGDQCSDSARIALAQTQPFTGSQHPLFRREKHTDTVNRRFPRTYGKLWELGGKTKTKKIRYRGTPHT
eukprot:632053-Pyramimonas_sp.AAC.1